MSAEGTVPGWLRVVVLALSAALIVVSGLVLYRNGRLPASVPDDAPGYALADLLAALRHVDSRGLVDVNALEQDRVPLDRFVAAMARTSPLSTPDRFPTVEDRVAFWLNAVHALTLQELIDSPRATSVEQLSRWRTWPIGGQRMSREAIVTRFLAETGDGRVWLALFDGSVGGPWLDSAPYGGDTLEPQLTDAARRFLRRADVVQLSPPVVRLSPRLTDHLDDFVSALPPGRTGVLQVLWAFLPDSCDGVRPGCDTRADLDRACGNDFQRCRVETLTPARSIARSTR
ncbi:MAG: DUF547 domain-containing protein [Myxococcaceae bacterium]|nr:DUF547 domain-containing protein [Myxococcaceae bacterium]